MEVGHVMQCDVCHVHYETSAVSLGLGGLRDRSGTEGRMSHNNKGYKGQSKFYISSANHKVIVLGNTWLVEHNPSINWHTGEVNLTCCPDYCGQAKSDSSRLDNDISIQPVKMMSDTSERIHVTTMISTRLAEEAKGDTPTAKLKEMLLKPYLDFWDVFSKEPFDGLLEQKQWDHAIDLKPESQPFSTMVYPMSPIKQKELDDFLKENLSSGHICPSKSPMASPVFFVKKKDGKLQFAQDYQKLNVMTVKNTTCSPLYQISSIKFQTPRQSTS